jgi:hypothetical protein
VSDNESQKVFDIPDPVPGQRPGAEDEFAHVPSPRRHPAIALSATALALFLIFQVRSDVLFALSSSTPIELGDARKVAATKAADLPLNRVVRISGLADRESGVLVDTQGSWHFNQFFRLLGTESGLYIRRVSNPIPVELARKDVFTGRLTRFKDLSFQAAIRRHFANRVSATHFFSAEVLGKALSATPSGPLRVADLLGETRSLSPTDTLTIDTARPDVMTVDFPKEKFATLAAAKAAVESKGGLVLEEGVGDEKSVSLTISFTSEKRDTGMSELGDLHPNIRFQPARMVHGAQVSDLSLGNQALILKSKGIPLTLPFKDILAVRTLSTVQIPDDALLLYEGDRPGEHWTSVVVAAFLLVFALLNLLSLRGKA